MVERRFDMKQVLRAAFIIQQKGELRSGVYHHEGFALQQSHDGYSLEISAGPLRLRCYFHNRYQCLGGGRKDLDRFKLCLARLVEDHDRSAGPA